MKKITFLKPLSLLLSLFCAVNIGFGHTIFKNDINDNNPSTGNPFSLGQEVSDNITTYGIGRGSGILPNSGSDRYNARGWNSTSFDSNDYFYFTISPNSNYKIDFYSFTYTGTASGSGPTNFVFRSSVDGFTTNIGNPTANGITIDLSSSDFQNITSSITFRIYAWGATAATGTFSINDFAFIGNVSATSCSNTTTWNGATWSAGAPDINTNAIIDANYNTSSSSFSACSLTINSGSTLTIADNTFVEIENDVNVEGQIIVETQGAFVQNDDAGTFNLISSGTATVNKQTPPKAKWYHYTYWSSPVVGATIGNVFPNVDGDRRFWFNAANYLDQHTVGTNNNIPDDIDDNGDDWQYAYSADIMQPGVGYAATASRFHFPNGTDFASFIGAFNTGTKSTTIYYNPLNTLGSWNLIGNPYPCALDFASFYTANSSTIAGAAYFWSQSSAPSSSNGGNQQYNFSKNDYAILTAGSGGIKTDAFGDMPNGYIPSGQAFFIAGIANGNVTFTNAMRVADQTSNSQFFKNTNSKKTSIARNKLWINLTSNNGVFNQILTAYVDGATNNDDGLFYDAPKLPSDALAILYTTIEGSNKKFAIQGKSPNSINESETIKLGFKTSINVATIYTLSIDQLEGDFLNSNTIYLKDNLLNKVHNLSASDYAFTSGVGEFNDRFVISFSNQALAIEDVLTNKNNLKIIDLDNNYVQFKASNNLHIKTITIFDLMGRQLYEFKGNASTETFKLSNLSNSMFIAKVELANGAIISKKAYKK